MSIFSYESKFTQTLMFIADLAILNILYVLCCIPIFTIGAAQAGLYSGIRALQDPESELTPSKAFWQGMKTGFKKVTIAWGLMTLALVAILIVFYFVVGFGQTIAGAPVWMSLIGAAIVMLLQAPIPLFHARFDCTATQLLRNSCFLLMAHPLRTILMMVLLWLPMVLLALDLYLFVMTGIAWLMLYYSVALLLSYNIMKKPFQVLIDHYNETHGIVPEEKAEEAEEAEV